MAGPATIFDLQSTSRTGPRTYWEKIFLFAVGALSSTIMLKIGAVQVLEVIYLIQIVVILTQVVRADGKVTVFRPLAHIGIYFAWFCTASLVLAVAAVRFDFYLPDDLSLLKRPILITLSRIIELTANVTMMLYLADQFRRYPGKARFTMRVFFWTGVASGVYSIVTYPLDVAGIISLGSYLDTHRLRGFYNEGGPWGLYLLTVVSVGYVLDRLKWESRPRIWIGWAIVAAVLPGSASKAAAVAVPIFLLLTGLFARSLATRILVLAGLAVLTLTVYRALGAGAIFRTYLKSSDIYERESHRHEHDSNFVVGRVAGLFIVPRMVAAHPLTGIGWGNYGLLRNSPEYRGASAWGDGDDDPGLGIAGLTADLGLPLLGFLVICLAMPFVTLRPLKVPGYIIGMALLQPTVHLCGAQLNLTYPWVVTSFALGLAFWWIRAARPSALPVSS